MLKDYNLHPAIDRTKCFRLTPPDNISREKPPPDSHWVDDFYRSCCEATNTTPKEPNAFQEHLGSDDENIPAPVKNMHSQLKEALYILFRRFSGTLDGDGLLGPLTPNEKTTLAVMLMEGAGQCIDGFLDRALNAVSRLSQPQNLDEYLYRVRQGLTEKAVLGLPMGSGVHAWNQATITAEKEGLGIQATYSGDRYQNVIQEGTIKDALQKTFERWFTPYELPALLRDALLNEVAKVGYEGKKEDTYGYVYGLMAPITNTVSRLLPDLSLLPDEVESWKKIFAQHPTEDGNSPLYDLKWDFILGSIWQSLIENNYLDSSRLKPRNLLDYATYLRLCQAAPQLQDSDLHRKLSNVSAEETLIQDLFRRKQYWQLGLILEGDPSYGKHLLGQTAFLAHTGELAQSLHDRSGEAPDEKIRPVLLTLTTMLSMVNQYDETLRGKLFQVFTRPWSGDTYLSLTLEWYPGLLPKVLEVINQYRDYWPTEALHAALFGVKSGTARSWLISKADILGPAVVYPNPQILKELLQFLERHSANDPRISEETRELFLRSRPYSYEALGQMGLLELKQRYLRDITVYAVHIPSVQPEALQQLLDFIIRNSRTIFNDSDLNQLLNINYAALRSNPAKLKIVLRCLLSNEIRLSDGTLLPCLLPNASSLTTASLPMQWNALLGGVKNDTELAHMLLLRISAYKPKLPEPAEKLLISFVLAQLNLFDLSDSKQKELFKKILSNMEDTNPLLQRLLMDDTVRNQWKANLPDLLRVLLPNHLETLQQKLQSTPSPVRRAAQSLTGLFRSDPADDLKLLKQRVEFTQRWINALTKPDHSNSGIESALMELMSDSKDFFAQNEAWHPLFNAYYEQMLAAPPSNPSAPTAGR